MNDAFSFLHFVLVMYKGISRVHPPEQRSRVKNPEVPVVRDLLGSSVPGGALVMWPKSGSEARWFRVSNSSGLIE